MALLHLFDATKKQLYSDEQYQAFLDPDVLNFKDMQERKVIRKANLATFISGVFGTVDLGFFHLNEAFLTTMAPDGGRLLKEMAKLFLDLKTQVNAPQLLTNTGIHIRHGATFARPERNPE